MILGLGPVGFRGPIRFRRTDYLGRTSTEPKWHRSVNFIDKKSNVGSLEALCGYKLSASKVLRGFDLSRAKKAPRGELCKKCEAAASKEETK